jgi:uncharacterized protein YaiI (UPF0178 family)
MVTIFVDADACPVKDEVYRVASRHGVPVVVVAASRLRVPSSGEVELVVVGPGADAADDWIASHAATDDIVVTGDIPLAARCLEKGARVLGHTGRAFTEENIGEIVATRDLLSGLRETGTITGGPAPFGPKDRSKFLQALHETIEKIRRAGRRSQQDPS